MSTLLLRTILNGTWMLREQEAESVASVVQLFMEGNLSALSEFKSEARVTYCSKNGAFSEKQMSSGDSGDKDQEVALIPVKQIITKYNYCGDLGTQTIDRMLKRLDNDPSIAAVVFDMDTPGGEGSYLQNIHTTIKNMRKPVLTHYSGQCCSAGYYMASATDKIYASSPADEVGSIGTYLSFRSPNPEYKDSPTVIHTIYASKSTDKNREFREAMDGKYDLLRVKNLDPFNQFFLNAVEETRPDVDKEVFSGSTYYSEEAIEKGLIDGIKSLDEVIKEAFTLSQNDMGIFNKKNKQMKKFENLSKILGREVDEKSTFTAEELEQIENHKADAPAATLEVTEEAPDLEATVEAAVTSALKPMTEKLGQIEAKMDSVTERVETLEGSAGAQETQAVPGKENRSKEEVPAWEDPENPVNKAIDEKLNSHGMA